ncbi:MAG: hypothetical protein WA941_18985 [Nitrososphaeraceae archaeon]
MSPKTLAIVTAMLLTAMIAISGGISSFTTNNATAQMTGNMTSNMMRQGEMMGQGMGMGIMDGRLMGMGPGMMIGNQSTTMQMMGADSNVTGSINLHSTISNAIASQVKVSLSQAASTAEGAVGNNSHAVAAHIGEANGYLTYCVWVLGPDKNMNMVIVDPGNGQVLSNRQISLQHPMMAGMHFGMMGPGMTGMGSGMMGPGMMGPGMTGMGSGVGMMSPGMMW